MSHTILFLTTFWVILGLTMADSFCPKAPSETRYNSKCQGCPPKYNGTLCASSTHFGSDDRHIGTGSACECTYSNKINGIYTTAVNKKMLEPLDQRSERCESNCGLCFKLCPTGGCPQNNPNPNPRTMKCIDVMVIDQCNDPGWCGQEMSPWECVENPKKCETEVRNTNKYGYPAHFDLHDYHGQVRRGLGWENIELTFEEIECPSSHKEAMMEHCYCNKFAKFPKFEKVTWSKEYLSKNKNKPDL